MSSLPNGNCGTTMDRRRAIVTITAAFAGVGTCHAATKAVRQSQHQPEVPWLAKVTKLRDPLPTDPVLAPLMQAAGRPRAESLAHWKQRRITLLRDWQAVLGALPPRPVRPPQFEVLESTKTDHVVRQRIRYATLPGETTEAYLLKPVSKKEAPPRAGFAVFHSTVNHSIRQPAGVQGKPEKAFGWHLANRGHFAICPRNFLWPTNDGISASSQAAAHLRKYPGTLGMARMLWEAQLAVDILAGLSGVDPQRLGSVGHSLGAKEVLYLAAFDERIKVTVSSEGGIGLPFSNWNAPWYLGPAINQPQFQRNHHELLAFAAPRPFLLLGGDSADGEKSTPYIAAAQQIYQLYGAPIRLGLFNHKAGHSVPQVAFNRTLEWLETYV